MKTEIFSAAWAREWSRRLNRSASYRDAARDWEGSIALVILRNSRDPDDRLAVYADLVHGECKSARPASAEDLESARYVLTGLAPAWKSVLAGKTAPLMAVMTGKLKLTRGSLATLAPFANAAKELVEVAQSLDAEFPEGWE